MDRFARQNGVRSRAASQFFAELECRLRLWSIILRVADRCEEFLAAISFPAKLPSRRWKKPKHCYRPEEWRPLGPCGVQALRSSNNCRSALGIAAKFAWHAVNRASRKIDWSQGSTRACARLFGASFILKVRPNRPKSPARAYRGLAREAEDRKKA